MNWKKVAYAVAPMLLAGGLYLSGSDVLAKTVTKVVSTITKGTLVTNEVWLITDTKEHSCNSEITSIE